MKYCSRCGNELTEKDVFCSKCGAKASRYAVDSLDAKPDAGKTEKHAALIGESVPGARYTAAVEKNAIGVTEYLRRAADLELMRYGINRIGWSLELKEAETVKKVEAEDEALKTFREKEENVEKRINDYQKREYREKVYSFTPKPEPKMLGIVFGGFILLYIILLIAKLDWGILKFPGTLIFVVLPIGLLFSEQAMTELQTISIIAALPISVCLLLVLISSSVAVICCFHLWARLNPQDCRVPLFPIRKWKPLWNL